MLALMAGAIAFVTIQQVISTPKKVVEPTRVPALIAARDMPLHTLLAEGDLTVLQVPPETLPDGALADPQAAVGKLTKGDIARGEVILERDLIAPDYVGPAAAFVMDPKQVIVAFPANDLLTVADVVRPDDHVDLMFSFDPSRGVPEGKTVSINTLTVLQDVRIAGIVYDSAKADKAVAGAHGPARALLLALDPQDALTVKYLRDLGAAADFALRSPVASGTFDVVPVDGEYIMQRYHIRWQEAQ